MSKTIRFIPRRGPAENIRPAGPHKNDPRRKPRATQKAALRHEVWA